MKAHAHPTSLILTSLLLAVAALPQEACPTDPTPTPTPTPTLIPSPTPGQCVLFADSDGDGYGDSGHVTFACGTPGYVTLNGDCDDGDAQTFPGAAEACDGRDNDCDGAADEGLPTYEVYPDADGDGYGAGVTPQTTCASPLPGSGWSVQGGDCDDTTPQTNPGAYEILNNSRDDDCDGVYDEYPIQVEAGDRFSLILDSEGTLWAMGDGNSGRLGSGDEAPSSVPKRVVFGGNNIKIEEICAGEDFALARDAQGYVWGFGDNFWGQLTEDVDGQALSPVWLEVAAGGSARSIACGVGHGLAVVGGQVYGWGYNHDGQIGLGGWGTDTEIVPEATLVPGLSGITWVAAGWYTSFARNNVGAVVASGLNSHGQLGINKSDPESRTFESMSFPTGVQIQDLDGGAHRGGAVDSDGKAWGWGSLNGRCDGGSSMKPLTLDLGTYTGVGISLGMSHGIVVTEEGAALPYGEGYSGALGMGTDQDLPCPLNAVTVRGDVLDAAAGKDHSLILLEDGRVLASGDNEKGQLGTGDNDPRMNFTPVVGFGG